MNKFQIMPLPLSEKSRATVGSFFDAASLLIRRAEARFTYYKELQDKHEAATGELQEVTARANRHLESSDFVLKQGLTGQLEAINAKIGQLSRFDFGFLTEINNLLSGGSSVLRSLVEESVAAHTTKIAKTIRCNFLNDESAEYAAMEFLLIKEARAKLEGIIHVATSEMIRTIESQIRIEKARLRKQEEDAWPEKADVGDAVAPYLIAGLSRFHLEGLERQIKLAETFLQGEAIILFENNLAEEEEVSQLAAA